LGQAPGAYWRLYDPNSHHALVRQTGIHPQLAAQAALGIVFFCLGFPDQALAQSNKAIPPVRAQLSRSAYVRNQVHTARSKD
jgi:hypothetical protein